MDSQLTSCLMLSAWLWAAWSLWRSREILRGTTLVTVLPWASAAVALWLIFAITGLIDARAPWRSHLSYFASVVSLTPVIAVLGARRPTCRVWPAFVLLPMVVVLSWPLVTMNWSRALELETPHVVIFGLVVVMGFGNYAGTRLTGPGFAASSALVLVPLVHSRLVGRSQDQRALAETAAVIALALATGFARRAVVCGSSDPAQVTATSAVDRFNRVWDDFVNLFGLVWSRRLLDRLQLLAQKQGWNCEVASEGFVAADAADPATMAAIAHALRWLLRRFVDPVWLDDRLGQSESGEKPSLTLDI